MLREINPMTDLFSHCSVFITTLPVYVKGYDCVMCRGFDIIFIWNLF